jgi:hypothetical protein
MMPPTRTVRPRIPSIPRRRPPDFLARHFARNPKLFLVSSALNPRPQLAFLNPSTNRSALSRLHTRLFTSKTRRIIQEQWHFGWRWFILCSAVSAFIIGEGLVISHELLEREFPTPHEWGLFNRSRYHSAKAFELPEATPLGLPLWEYAGKAWKKLLKHLEDPNDEGAGIKEQEEGGIFIPGVGKAGYDVSIKPEAWRRGYFETLMGCANVAEHMDERVWDRTRDLVFPAAYMIGPSNPEPKPCPAWMPEPPLEENCEPAFDPPEMYYIKLLTTKGFTTKQKLSAAIAYGEWLDFKSQHQAAEETLRWGLDIAASPLKSPSDYFDPVTAIIKPTAPIVTENILSAANALAVHHAQTGNTTAALPIFVSILRARRNCPEGSILSKSHAAPKRIEVANQTDIGAFVTYTKIFWSIFKPVDFPPPPPTGDEPFERNAANDCEEAAVMSYVGEILFATSKKEREAGLNWTRDAVALANERAHDDRLELEAKRKCMGCVDVGLANWEDMVRRLVEEQETSVETKAPSKGWFGLGSNDADALVAHKEWLNTEEQDLQVWQDKIERDGLREKLESRPRPLWSYLYRLVGII